MSVEEDKKSVLEWNLEKPNVVVDMMKMLNVDLNWFVRLYIFEFVNGFGL